MTYKKISLAASALCVLALCCGFAVRPAKSKPQGPPLDMQIQNYQATACPLAIVNARRLNDGLSIEVQNVGPAAVEYFELHTDANRLWAGRNSLFENLVNSPEVLKEPELRLAPQQVRTFEFKGSAGSTIKVGIVLLSNGQGWLKGFWLKKLDKANGKGLLWDIDREENLKQRLASGRVKPVIARNVGKSFSRAQSCWIPNSLDTVQCTSGQCINLQIIHAPASVGWYTRLDLESFCYEGSVMCATTEEVLADGTCPN